MLIHHHSSKSSKPTPYLNLLLVTEIASISCYSYQISNVCLSDVSALPRFSLQNLETLKACKMEKRSFYKKNLPGWAQLILDRLFGGGEGTYEQERSEMNQLKLINGSQSGFPTQWCCHARKHLAYSLVLGADQFIIDAGPVVPWIQGLGINDQLLCLTEKRMLLHGSSITLLILCCYDVASLTYLHFLQQRVSFFSFSLDHKDPVAWVVELEKHHYLPRTLLRSLQSRNFVNCTAMTRETVSCVPLITAIRADRTGSREQWAYLLPSLSNGSDMPCSHLKSVLCFKSWLAGDEANAEVCAGDRIFRIAI